MHPCALLFALAAAAPERVLVFDVAGEAFSETEAALVRDAIASALDDNRRLEVLTHEDLRRVLDLEAERQASGCTDDTCLAEIGAAMGASRVVFLTASRLGETIVLSAALLDPQGARALARTTERAATVEQLVERAPAIVEALGLSPPPPLLTLSGMVATGVGVAAVAACGGAWLWLYGAAQDPRGDPDHKQAWLDHRGTLLVGAGVGAAVALAGGALVVAGVLLE